MRRINSLIAGSLLLGVTACQESPTTEVAEWDGPYYEVTLTEDDPGRIRVSASLPAAPDGLHVSENGAHNLPDAWATFVSDLVMTDENGNELVVEKSGARGWSVSGSSVGRVELSYVVDLAHDTISWSGGIDGAALRLPWGAFFAGRAVFILPDGLEGPSRIAFRTSPDGKWQRPGRRYRETMASFKHPRLTQSPSRTGS